MRGCLCCAASSKKLGLAAPLAACIGTGASPNGHKSSNPLEEMLRLRMLRSRRDEGSRRLRSIRHDPIFKMAVGQPPGERRSFVFAATRLLLAAEKCAVHRRSDSPPDGGPLVDGLLRKLTARAILDHVTFDDTCDTVARPSAARVQRP